jgi:hypothetical protein
MAVFREVSVCYQFLKICASNATRPGVCSRTYGKNTADVSVFCEIKRFDNGFETAYNNYNKELLSFTAADEPLK